MIPLLTPGGYAQTKSKLIGLDQRLAELEKRTDLPPDHLIAVRRSYQSMMRKYQPAAVSNSFLNPIEAALPALHPRLWA